MSQENKRRQKVQNLSYEKASSLGNALTLVGDGGRRILAGGTDLLLKIKHGISRSSALLDISRLDELRYIKKEDGKIRIGACVKLAELLNNEILSGNADMIGLAAAEIGSMEVRNMGTVGGNLCCARANCGVCFLPGCRATTGDRKVRPCRNAAYSDLLLPLVAYDAVAVLKNRNYERNIPIRQFLKTNGLFKLESHEILTEVFFEKPAAGGWGYARLRQPTKMGLPFVCAIAAFSDGAFDITVGGSVKSICTFEKVPDKGMVDKIAEKLSFNKSLYFSQDYRKSVASSIIREAMERALEGVDR